MEGSSDREHNPRVSASALKGANDERTDIDDDDDDEDDEDDHGGQQGRQQQTMLMMDEHRIAPNRPGIINAADVLCGRGKSSFNHVGNKRFRDMISAALDEYMQADTRFEKSIVVHRVVEEIHQQGGRFLKKHSGSDQWYELSQQRAKEKVGHAVRDAANLHEAKLKRERIHGSSTPLSIEASNPSHVPLSVDAPGYQSDSSTSTGRGSKRSALSSLETQRKRRRTTASPPHLPAEDALRSASALANTLPSNLKPSPISLAQPSSREASASTPLHSETSGVGGLVASLPASLRPSPIEQQQRQQQNLGQHGMDPILQGRQQPQQQQQQSLGQHGMDPILQGRQQPQQQQQQYLYYEQAANRGSLPSYTSLSSQQFPMQQEQHHLQRRSSMPVFDNMPYQRDVSLQQQYAPPPSLPLAPHARAAAEAGMLHAPNASFNDQSETVFMPQQQQQALRPGMAAHFPRQPDMMLPNNANMMNPLSHTQMMQHRERFFPPQASYQPYALAPANFPEQFYQGYRPNRADENEDFLAAIDSVLGPLQPDHDYSPIGASTSSGGYHEGAGSLPPTHVPDQHQQQQQQQQQELNHQIQRLQERIQEQHRRRMDDPEGSGDGNRGDFMGGPHRTP